jgi:hypothetical protein
MTEVIRNESGLSGEQIDERLGLPTDSPSGGFRGIFGMILRQGMNTIEKRGGGWFIIDR